LGCYEETASNERARRLNLPLKVLVESASSAYNQDSDMPLGSIQKKSAKHKGFRVFGGFFYIRKGANFGSWSHPEYELVCSDAPSKSLGVGK